MRRSIHRSTASPARARVATVVALAAGALLLIGAGPADAASGCNGVFSGATPRDPIIKTASASSATLGTSITFTFSWTSTGVGSTYLVDCFRVDGGDSSLDTIVEAFNYSTTIENLPAGTPMTHSYTLVLTPEATGLTVEQLRSLAGHTLSDRAKLTHGSKESRSYIVPVPVVAAAEVCADDRDNDFDGKTDEGCPTTEGSTQVARRRVRASGSGTEVRVLGAEFSRSRLAQTGGEAATAAWFGLLFLALGVLLRKPPTVRRPDAVFAGLGAAAWQVWLAGIWITSTPRWRTLHGH